LERRRPGQAQALVGALQGPSGSRQHHLQQIRLCLLECNVIKLSDSYPVLQQARRKALDGPDHLHLHTIGVHLLVANMVVLRNGNRRQYRQSSQIDSSECWSAAQLFGQVEQINLSHALLAMIS
jgi:hypothetical protein